MIPTPTGQEGLSFLPVFYASSIFQGNSALLFPPIRAIMGL